MYITHAHGRHMEPYLFSGFVFLVPLHILPCTTAVFKTLSLVSCMTLSGVYSGGLWGLEHPPVLPDNYETNLAISSILV